MSLLEEIAESRAEGRVAELYDDVRAVLGVPFVVLVYRALATVDGRLDAAWSAIRPNLLAPETHAAARELGTVEAPPIAPVSRDVVAASGLDRRLAAQTLAGFQRANTRNAIVLAALHAGHDGPPPPAAPAPRPERAVDAILPMVHPSAAPPGVGELLTAISASMAPASGAAAPDGPRPVIVPSLLRCFAFDRGLLEALWASLRDVVERDEHRARVTAIEERARAYADRLPYGIPRLADESAREIIGRFVPTIPTMIAAAPLIAAALELPAP